MIVITTPARIEKSEVNIENQAYKYLSKSVNYYTFLMTDRQPFRRIPWKNNFFNNKELFRKSVAKSEFFFKNRDKTSLRV